MLTLILDRPDQLRTLMRRSTLRRSESISHPSLTYRPTLVDVIPTTFSFEPVRRVGDDTIRNPHLASPSHHHHDPISIPISVTPPSSPWQVKKPAQQPPNILPSQDHTHKTLQSQPTPPAIQPHRPSKPRRIETVDEGIYHYQYSNGHDGADGRILHWRNWGLREDKVGGEMCTRATGRAGNRSEGKWLSHVEWNVRRDV